MMDVNHLNFKEMSKLFSTSMVVDISENETSLYFKEIFINNNLDRVTSTNSTLYSFFSTIYRLLEKHYRNEYIYKNTIANKILLGKHSLKTANMLTEFRAAGSKVDVAILNGTSTAYEIKTEFDSLNRLEKQIQSYCTVFEYINVVSTPQFIHILEKILPPHIGIMILTKRNSIATIRKPQTNFTNIDLSTLFCSLNKNEYLSIIKHNYGYIPDSPNTLIFDNAKKMYCQMDKRRAFDLTCSILKNRNNDSSTRKTIKSIPKSLTMCAINTRNRKKNLNIFTSKLKKCISTILD